jgi:hypothetical protein
MSYLLVIPLATAKNHLRIDSGFTADDASIQRMIASALALVEQNTSHILYARDKTYYRTVDNDRIVVFDYPINSYDTEVTALNYSLRKEFVADEITINVGYLLPGDVPSPLIEAALMIIENWYFEAENEGNKADIPERANTILFNYKRCIVS